MPEGESVVVVGCIFLVGRGGGEVGGIAWDGDPDGGGCFEERTPEL